jgi:hypothetical protein
MKRARIFLTLASAALALMLQMVPTSAQAQATRTWVSGVGDDANPCSRTAPCKTFAGAISKTATNGEISVLDPGGFGGVTIVKSISIVAASDEGGILIPVGTSGIILNGANIVVHLKGLVLEGALNAAFGVRFLQGAQLTIEDCVIRGVGAAAPNGIAIQFQSSTADSRLNVIDTLIESSRVGIAITATQPTFNTAFFDNVNLNQSQNGVGIEVNGNGASVSLLGSTVQGQINKLNGGRVFSFGNNVLFSGTPSQTLPLQ